LFLLGEGENASTAIAHVEAELCRDAIENFDTCTLASRPAAGVVCTVAMTHACERTMEPAVTIVTDRTEICLQHPNCTTCGTVRRAVVESDDGDSPWMVFDVISRRLRGDSSAPIATLESARVHTQLINAVAEGLPDA
jgi:hypothetical protein